MLSLTKYFNSKFDNICPDNQSVEVIKREPTRFGKYRTIKHIYIDINVCIVCDYLINKHVFIVIYCLFVYFSIP